MTLMMRTMMMMMMKNVKSVGDANVMIDNEY